MHPFLPQCNKLPGLTRILWFAEVLVYFFHAFVFDEQACAATCITADRTEIPIRVLGNRVAVVGVFSKILHPWHTMSAGDQCTHRRQRGRGSRIYTTKVALHIIAISEVNW